ncbi:alkaline protease [Colletotrichum tofieldiae]|nr:alkaline protease [Colletotrichum tofieldiae]GKT77730.1 alkaline protease [Colletotrichum tofieldiae]
MLTLRFRFPCQYENLDPRRGGQPEPGCQSAVARKGGACAFTVAAADWTRTRASFSNFGPLVEVFAPGIAVRSLNLGNGTTAY